MDIDWIEPNVLAVSQTPRDVQDIYSLREQGIRAIVTLTEYPLTTIKGFQPDLFEKLDIHYLHAPINDYQAPTWDRAWEITEFIGQMTVLARPVFMHCYAGVGRTGTMLHVYLLARGMTLEEAKAQILYIRPQNDYDALTDSQQAFLMAVDRAFNSRD